MHHHAYYIEGSLSQFDAHKAALRPFWSNTYERFGIDESRELIALASLKNFPAQGGSQTLFFIATSSITSEAQQALLKLFEEPQAGTVFVLLVPHGALLPTLKSRMLEYTERQFVLKNSLASPARPARDAQDEETRGLFSKQIAVEFLQASGKERSDMIAALLKPARPNDLGRSGGDEEGVKERVRDFINALEAECIRLNFIQRAEGRQGLQDIAMVRDYIGDRSPSLKMLLEHLALALPQI